MKKMKPIIIALFWLMISVASFGQELVFDVHNLKLSDFIEIEKVIGSELIPNNTNHLSGRGIAQPIQFLRKQEVIPDLITQYFFYEKDSTIAYILHEWDVRNFDKESSSKEQPLEFILALIEKYIGLENEIITRYGKGAAEGSLDSLHKINEKDGLKINHKWNPNDSLEIEMYASISNYFEKRGAMTVPTYHRIRLYIRNEKGASKPKKLTEQRLDTLETLVHHFIQALKENKFEHSKEFLSELIAEQATKEQLQQIREIIKFEKELELIYHGIQMGMDGGYYVLMQFRYVEKEGDSKEMIKVIFDDEDKIAGFQPMKMN